MPRIWPRVPAASASDPTSSQARAAGVFLQVAVEALREDAQHAGYAELANRAQARADRVARPSLIKRTLVDVTRFARRITMRVTA